MYGGVQQLVFGPGGTHRRILDVDPGELERRLVLVNSGVAHASAPSNWKLFRRRIENQPGSADRFAAIGSGVPNGDGSDRGQRLEGTGGCDERGLAVSCAAGPVLGAAGACRAGSGGSEGGRGGRQGLWCGQWGVHGVSGSESHGSDRGSSRSSCVRASACCR